MAQDGVIKFQMQHTPAAALPWDQLAELNAWRKILVLLECIGQTPARYDNIGFGNISCRIDNIVGSVKTLTPCQVHHGIGVCFQPQR